MPRKKKTALQYELTYHIPLEDSGWPKRHNIAYRTENHMVTAPTTVTKTFGDLSMDGVKAIYKEDGWAVTEAENGFLCERDGVVNEYTNLRIVRI